MQGDSRQARAWRQQRREQLIAERQAISASLRQQWQKFVVQEVVAHLDRLRQGNVGFYLPIHGELDCRSLAELLISKGWRSAIPVMHEGIKTLTFCEWGPDMEMITGIWNIPIPKQQIVVRPDVLIIPLVGFDDAGYRLGYGGGFYDRTLAAMPSKPLTIGVGLEQSYCETIYPHQFDIGMDMIVTEQQVRRFG